MNLLEFIDHHPIFIIILVMIICSTFVDIARVFHNYGVEYCDCPQEETKE